MPREAWRGSGGHRFDVLGSREWALRTRKVLYEYEHGAPAVMYTPGFWDRPPIGPPLAGRAATASGRGHRRIVSGEEQGRRRRLAMEAYRLRTEGGLTVRAIAARLGVGKTTIGRWLYGVLPNDWNVFGDRRVKPPLVEYRPPVEFRDSRHPGHSLSSRWDGTSNRMRERADGSR